MSEDDDTELVRRCAAGDRRAFEGLVLKYQRPVYNAALRMLRNPEDARDVTQTVFLKVFAHLAEYDPTRRFYSWIYRIALNESLNQLGGRRRTVPVPENEAGDGPLPDEVLETTQSGRCVQDALMMLTDEHRAVIVLRHFLDLSYEDMAGILQVPERTVKSRLFSARQRLGEVLNARGVQGP